MKKIKILFIVSQLWTIDCCYGQAQPFVVNKATRQGFAGGVVGNYGVNYHIELLAESKKNVPDSIWINGKVYPLDFSKKGGSITVSTDSATRKMKYTISEGEFHSGFRGPNYQQGQKDTNTQKPKPVRQFEGVAMVSYMVKHKEHFFIIKSFTVLRQVDYP